MITAADIRAAGVVFERRVAFSSGGAALIYRSHVWPELVIKVFRPGPDKREMRALFIAGERIFPYCLDHAAELLNARRSAREAA